MLFCLDPDLEAEAHLHYLHKAGGPAPSSGASGAMWPEANRWEANHERRKDQSGNSAAQSLTDDMDDSDVVKRVRRPDRGWCESGSRAVRSTLWFPPLVPACR